MTKFSGKASSQGDALILLYDTALADVYGYLVSRCGSVVLAEDLTSEVFMAAVSTAKAGRVGSLNVAWLISVARNKLIDHWRHNEVEHRHLPTLIAAVEGPETSDEWDVVLDAMRSNEVLEALGAHHRSALTLRYLDGLGVPEVADQLGRTIHATEALLVRARLAFRRLYGEDL